MSRCDMVNWKSPPSHFVGKEVVNWNGKDQMIQIVNNFQDIA